MTQVPAVFVGEEHGDEHLFRGELFDGARHAFQHLFQRSLARPHCQLDTDC